MSLILALVVLVVLTVTVEDIDHAIDGAIERTPEPIDDLLFMSFYVAVAGFGLVMVLWHRHGAVEKEMRRALSVRLAREARARKEREARASRVQELLDSPRDLRIVYQPIVELATGSTYAYEALARFPDGAFPESWFSEAAQAGRLEALETLATARALEGLPELPEEVYLSINVSPPTLSDRGFFAIFLDVPTERLILELTEHLPIDEYEEQRGRLAKLRGLGLRLAVDDAGAGWASLRHILELRPDIVKADRTLLAGVPEDPVPTALLKGLAEFVHAIPSAIIIAEGIEREAQVAVLRQVDINYGQGYLLGRPEPLAGG